MPVTLTKGLDEKCCDCGIAIRKIEVDGELEGRYADYGEHEQGDIHLKFCSGCWGRIKEILKKDHGDAILKRKELEREGAKEARPLTFPDPDIDDFRTPDGAGVGM
jgi:hypothetical protein